MSRHKIIDDAEDVLNSAIKPSEREIFQQVQKLLTKFNSQGGKIVFDSQTVNLINDAEKRILTALNRSGYDSRVKSYLKDFDKVKESTVAEQKKLNGINVAVRPLNNLQKSAIQQTTNMLLGNGLDFNLIQPVKDVLLNAASSGMTIAQAELQLRKVILGDSERLGKLERYVTQIARDSISQYDGMLQSRIAEEYELDGCSYEGSLIKDSRPQCRRWVAMGEIPVKDLKEEIQWAYNNGSGMIPNTTPKSFFIYRGGWQCRHFATPIRL